MTQDQVIDASKGGGSLLRIAAPVSLAREESIEIFNIRINRDKPGLRYQHLEGLEALCQITGSELSGGEIGSTRVRIKWGRRQPRSEVSINLETAASVSLIFQALSNYCFVRGTSVTLRFLGGGTHTNWSPTFDYLQHVTRPTFQLFRQKIDIHLEKVGYYPRGGGAGSITISSEPIKKVELHEFHSEDHQVVLISRASKNLQRSKVAERQLKDIRRQFSGAETSVHYDLTESPGSSLTAVFSSQLLAKGYSSLGRRGMPAEKVGLQLVERIQSEKSTIAVDCYMADQLIIPLAMAPKGSLYSFPEMTDHVQTNVDLTQKLFGNIFSVAETDGGHIITRI